MNHPKPEEFVTYLYGEANGDARRQLRAHLEACPECRMEVERWKRSIHRLDAWKLPRTKAPVRAFAPVLKWAAAAAVVLALGFILGHYTGVQAIERKVTARLEPQVRQALRQEMAQMVREEVNRSSAALLQTANDQTQKSLIAYTTESETRFTENLQRLYLALKGQLDTVAINTEKEFVQLASYHPPGTNNHNQ